MPDETHTPDELLMALEGSAEEAVRATGQKVQTMQMALTWLLDQQKVWQAAMEAASSDRAALRARVDELEGQVATMAKQQSDGLEELKAGLEATGKALEAQATESQERHEAVLGELREASGGVSALKDAQADIERKIADRNGDRCD